jgi:hypothetical protein
MTKEEHRAALEKARRRYAEAYVEFLAAGDRLKELQAIEPKDN